MSSVKSFLNRLLWASGPLGFIVRTMSVVLLVTYGFENHAWSATAQVMIDYWDWLVGVIFSNFIPVAPLLHWILQKLAENFEWASVPELYPHWKHVFVLLMTIFASFTKQTFIEKDYLFGSYGMVVGTIFALLSALGVGVIPLSASDFQANFLVAAVPALFFWMTILIVWLPRGGIGDHDMRDFLARCIVTLTLIASVSFYLVYSNVFEGNVNIGLLCLAGFVIAIGINRIYFGFKEAQEDRTSFFTNPKTQRGLSILSAFIGAAAFVFFSAGWTLVKY